MTIIQLGRYGDILTLLPLIQTGRFGVVNWVVCEEFANILENQEFVTPVIWRGPVDDVQGAVESIRMESFLGTEYRVTQVNRNPSKMSRGVSHNFQHEMFLRAGAGLEELIHLPLKLEYSKERWGESRTVRIGVGECSTLVYHTAGVSSSYDPNPMLESALMDLERDMMLFPTAQLKCDRIIDMCQLLHDAKERGGVLVTVDTALLHLAYAVGIPTVALVPDDFWVAAITRKHWIARVTHSRSRTHEGIRFICERIRQYRENWALDLRLTTNGRPDAPNRS